MRTYSARNAPQLVTLALIAIITMVPLASSKIPIPRASLHGMQNSIRFPTPSKVSISKGAFQKGVDRWAIRNHPLWAWSVKIANQAVYALTGEVSLDYGTSVQGGREGFLWQPMYLRSINKNEPAPEQVIFDTFRDLKRSQELLGQHNIPVIAVINPNLLALYPELLPDKYKVERSTESSYSVSQRAIETFHPAVIDTFVMFKNLKATAPFRFFAPTGSHWNDVASCMAARLVTQQLAVAWNEVAPNFSCETWHMEDSPRPPEFDLLEIANFLFPKFLYQPTPYVTNKPAATFRAPKKVLLVGTSFLFGLESQLLAHKVADSTTLLFYFRSVRRNGVGNFQPFDKRRLTKEILLSYDAVIVDANVAGPGVMGYGALQLINRLLDPEEAKLQAKRVKQTKKSKKRGPAKP